MLYIIKNCNFLLNQDLSPQDYLPHPSPSIHKYNYHLNTRWRTRVCVYHVSMRGMYVRKRKNAPLPMKVVFTSSHRERFNLVHRPAPLLPPAIPPLRDRQEKFLLCFSISSTYSICQMQFIFTPLYFCTLKSSLPHSKNEQSSLRN